MNLYEKINKLRGNTPIYKVEELCGMSQNSIKKWESKHPRSDLLIKVATHFGVTLDYLCDRPQSEIQTFYDQLSTSGKTALTIYAENLLASEQISEKVSKKQA